MNLKDLHANLRREAAKVIVGQEEILQVVVALLANGHVLLEERRVTLDTLNRKGVLTLDVPAQKLTMAVINKYLELKAKTLL